ncbi:hypothetical protein NDU88_003113 [Pleurodeles waltl]|uniref:Uncharacterized protein n=1 Tax=Pleurodeles waltl TaxID=8319 RepID=A0AAV7QE00_PLEWA|nr:hypothetical protein NDU88_003113 [Pleurodeles waltl]
MQRSTQDVIPTGSGWSPATIGIQPTQEKRKATNNQASLVLKAVHPDLMVKNKVIMRDRHPGWKFRTPLENEVCDIVNVQQDQSYAASYVSWCKCVGAPEEGQEGRPREIDDMLERDTLISSPQQGSQGCAEAVTRVVSTKSAAGPMSEDTNT